MSLYQAPTPHSDSIRRPACKQCGTQMMLARIEAEHPNHERRMFECFRCQHSEIVVAPLA